MCCQKSQGKKRKKIQKKQYNIKARSLKGSERIEFRRQTGRGINRNLIRWAFFSNYFIFYYFMLM